MTQQPGLTTGSVSMAAPGMPQGSPGMPSPTPERYDVIAFGRDRDSVFHLRRRRPAVAVV